MRRGLRTIIFLNLLALGLFSAARQPDGPKNALDRLLRDYLDKLDELDEMDGMQSDQPQQGKNEVYPENSRNFSAIEYSRAMRNRSKEKRIEDVKNLILSLTQRKPDDADVPEHSINISQIIPPVFNITGISTDDQAAEKIRSFYPSCEIPLNTDHDVWQDDDTMNLFFDFELLDDAKNGNIAAATLRLYRLPEEPSTKSPGNARDCDNLTSSEDDRLLRVSIYWYTKSLKKRRVKRRLSDSKVIPESAKWVELSVKPAAKAWAKGRNLGMSVLVEDQDGNTVRADRIFKGASCTVGVSTPKPIPTIIVDAARRSNDFDRIQDLLGRRRNSSAPAATGDDHLLPTIDVRTLEFPYSYKDRPAEAAAPDVAASSDRHIRHQRQHSMQEGGNSSEFDVRQRMVGRRVVFTQEDIRNMSGKFNLSTINR
ncbi:unnamed protein product [Phyllotreta striolata]|uniref:TGF-beta propeptide domain-containing protein n=1 Tax=Phyllotreta striolata TaxID=444603 RepID=A0A9P0GNW5_PHYSR|nr:unnamed protein product [Phyllotreta striolata]